MGYKVVFEPKASAYHLGSVAWNARQPTKLLYQTQNRIATNIKNLSLPNLAIAMAAEVGNAACILGGTMVSSRYRAFGKAYLHGLGRSLARLPRSVKARGLVQGRREIGDRKVLTSHRRVGVVARTQRYLALVRTGSEHLFG